MIFAYRVRSSVSTRFNVCARRTSSSRARSATARRAAASLFACRTGSCVASFQTCLNPSQRDEYSVTHMEAWYHKEKLMKVGEQWATIGSGSQLELGKLTSTCSVHTRKYSFSILCNGIAKGRRGCALVKGILRWCRSKIEGGLMCNRDCANAIRHPQT